MATEHGHPQPATIAVDFDGTCVAHAYPHVGPDVHGCVPVLQALVNAGHKLILFTMRSGSTLDDAVQWFSDRNLPLWGINTNPEQKRWTMSPKAYAQVYIDDAALGCPLVHSKHVIDHGVLERPYVDWPAVHVLLRKQGLLKPL